VTSKDTFRQNQIKCPECESGENLRKIKDFYRCSGCKNEWFKEELIVIPFKTALFQNEDGKNIFMAMTPEKIAEFKERGVAQKAADTRRKRKGLSYKDKNLLRRLKK